MKHLVVLLFFLPFACFGQESASKKELKQEIELLNNQLMALQEVNTKLLSEQVKLLEEFKKSGIANSELINKLKTQNETLRQIMIEYVGQIDELNTINLQLEAELDKCKDGKWDRGWAVYLNYKLWIEQFWSRIRLRDWFTS